MISFKRIKLLVLLSFIFSTPAKAQKYYTITEAVNGMSTTLAMENLKLFSWLPDNQHYIHLINDGKNANMLISDIHQSRQDTIAMLAEINSLFDDKEKLKSVPALRWMDDGSVSFQKGQQLYLGKINGNKSSWTLWRTLPEKANTLTFDVHNKNIFYLIDNNIVVQNETGHNTYITQDNDSNIINGQAVHRNEFGINKGLFPSPKGNYLAYFRMDQRMVKDYPIINWLTLPATHKNIKYPMAGDASHQVQLVVYHPADGKKVTVNTGLPADQYLTSVSWSPDEQWIFVGLLNRDQNHLQLNQYHAQTGEKLKTLFEERDEKYVEPQHSLYFLPNSTTQFIWWSQRDGYMHLYLYDLQKGLQRQLTKGKYVVNEMVGVSASTRELIITSSKESPLTKNIYAVSWRNGKMRRLDNATGTHHAMVSKNGNLIYDNYSSDDYPRRIQIYKLDGQHRKIILEADDPLKEYSRPSVRYVEIEADEGHTLYGKIMYPIDFDETKKYPVIVYLYNGPHVQLVKNYFPNSGNLWYEYMTQKGYVVFTLDGRGSSNRGLAFEQAPFRKLGTLEMEDQLEGVRYLKSLKFVDPARMGVHGWSYGGFMTTSLMLRHPNVFKAGVAGGPVLDWRMYEIMYTERYMDQPQTNPQGYEESNLMNKVNNLKGNLLMIHGTDDDVVVWQHSMNFIKKAVDEGVHFDYFIYPGHAHNVRGKDRVHLMKKVSDYFDLYLQPK